MERFDLTKYRGQKVVAIQNGGHGPCESRLNVEIIRTDIQSSWPVLAVVKYSETYEECYQFNKDGVCQDDNARGKSLFDLYFAPVKHVRWVNVYKIGKIYTNGGYTYDGEMEAKENISDDKCEKYVATVPIEFED